MLYTELVYTFYRVYMGILQESYSEWIIKGPWYLKKVCRLFLQAKEK